MSFHSLVLLLFTYFSPRGFPLSQFPVIFITLSSLSPSLSCSSFFSRLALCSFVFFRLSLSPLLPSSSSCRQMAGLWVMVRCQGGVVAFRVDAAEDIQLCPEHPSPSPSRACALPGRRACSVQSRPAVSLQSHTYSLCAFACASADRMGFWRETAPRVRRGTDWSLSLLVLTH